MRPSLRAWRLTLVLLCAFWALPGEASLFTEPGDNPAQPDGRGGIDSLGPKLPDFHLSAGEIGQARRATGYFYCPSSDPRQFALASAALVLSNRLIVTNSHVVTAVLSRQGADGLARCRFLPQTFALRGDCIHKACAAGVRLDTSAMYFDKRITAANNLDYQSADYALVRLAAPVAGATPFAVAPAGGGDLKAGDPLLLISALAQGMRGSVPWTEPIVQECHVSAAFAGSGSTPSHFHSGCDAGGGMSGSLTLTRSKSGRLQIVGVLEGTPPPWGGIVPLSETGGTYSYHVGFDGDLLAEAKRLAARR